MLLSDNGEAFIKEWEGLFLVAYDDGFGTWTIGWGHTDGVKKGDTCTLDQAEVWFKADMLTAETAVNQDVTVPLTQAQYDVLVSFTENEGVGALKSSTLLRELNGGNYTDVPTQLLRWDIAGQKAVPGLENRRKAEGVVWVQGSPPINPVQPDGSRTLNGASVVLVGGLATVATPVAEAIDKATPLWSLGSVSGLLIGSIIVLGALWVAYARLDDAGLIPWNRKYTPLIGPVIDAEPVSKQVPPAEATPPVVLAPSTDAPAATIQSP